jgi:hypothetical protein
MMTKEILKQALEALESDNPYIRQLAANALRNAFVQPEQEQENPALIEWKEQGEEIMAQAGIGFHLGAWWADRPWRQR